MHAGEPGAPGEVGVLAQEERHSRPSCVSATGSSVARVMPASVGRGPVSLLAPDCSSLPETPHRHFPKRDAVPLSSGPHACPVIAVCSLPDS